MVTVALSNNSGAHKKRKTKKKTSKPNKTQTQPTKKENKKNKPKQKTVQQRGYYHFLEIDINLWISWWKEADRPVPVNWSMSYCPF